MLLAPIPARAAGDPVLAELVRDSLAARPELRAAESRSRAARERVPQAQAFPDPTLSLGIQNDGFDSLEIGTMETSFVSIMFSQPLPWPGKRGLRGDVARLGADATATEIARIRLSVEAEVRRSYLDLLLARARLALLDRLATVWTDAESLARTRYEIGAVPQADLLRARLERTRLAQRRVALEADARAREQALNRLRGKPLDTAIATSAVLADVADPGEPADALADATARSPELAAARLTTRRAERAVDLARRDRYPDFGVSAGVMARGSIEPMWQVGVSMTLPFLWGRAPRDAAVREREAERRAGSDAAAAVEQELALRVAERRTALAGLVAQLAIYRDGLLTQSRIAVDSTLAQYRVGKVTYTAVLEAVAGLIRDEDEYLQTIAAAQRIAIARDEVSLAPLGGAAAPLGATPMPDAGEGAPAPTAGGM